VTHEELLAGYVRASLGVIAETSGSIARDARELREKTREYAQANGLALDEDAFDAYIEESYETCECGEAWDGEHGHHEAADGWHCMACGAAL
jgi:hypothetical protein